MKPKVKPSKPAAPAAVPDVDIKALARAHAQEALDLLVLAMRQKTSMPASRVEGAFRILQIANGTTDIEVDLIMPGEVKPTPPARVA